jgi:hypothetical protein
MARDENKVIPFNARALEMYDQRSPAIGRFDVEHRRFGAKAAGDYNVRPLFLFPKERGFKKFFQSSRPANQLDAGIRVELFSYAKALRECSRLDFRDRPNAADGRGLQSFPCVLRQALELRSSRFPSAGDSFAMFIVAKFRR